MLKNFLGVILIGCFLGNCLGADQKSDKNATSISTTDGCRLYLGDIIFTKFEPGAAGKKGVTTTVYVDGDRLYNDTEVPDDWCGKYNGSITLTYTDIKFTGEDKNALDSITLKWEITYQEKYGWWEVTSLNLTATGDMIKNHQLDANWTGAVMESMGFGAAKDFNYACAKPNVLMFSENKETEPVYKLQFIKMHLQPFHYTKKGKGRPGNADGFSDNVDDCVAFFSASVWMALGTFLIFVLVILSGVIMLSEMSTVNRFDDPKAKQLVIIPKD